MTEEEAKTKWCPFARVVASPEEEDGKPVIIRQHPAFNRLCMPSGETAAPSASRCIGSACMAWRWDVADPATYESAPGYCGLAGRP